MNNNNAMEVTMSKVKFDELETETKQLKADLHKITVDKCVMYVSAPNTMWGTGVGFPHYTGTRWGTTEILNEADVEILTTKELDTANEACVAAIADRLEATDEAYQEKLESAEALALMTRDKIIIQNKLEYTQRCFRWLVVICSCSIAVSLYHIFN
ncbi:MAG: hypothetical protein HRU18_02750 [Pseudoalteromonas sp.]|uniref:hypothetical protein n=1 Tax=Pseudoalteromonas sp. TaxID=53249 RepID=UPI001D569DE6|nr:hypothetical protein [Pseudoalteromonas sp.]NRA77103.1 hypothetical protein [Pseudoalteromonas sp.]